MVETLYLLDTNVLSEPVRPRPEPRLLEALQSHGDALCTASVVWHELSFGFERLPPSKKRSAIEAYLGSLRDSRSLPVLPYDEHAARIHAMDRAALYRAGRPVPFRDGQIAAIAKTHGAVLVTANIRDFEPIPDLVVENWLDP